MAIWVGRHLLPGYHPLQLPFLTGDGKILPAVSEYGVLDAATKQLLPVNQTKSKRRNAFASQATKAVITLHTFANTETVGLHFLGGMWVRSHRVGDLNWTSKDSVDPPFIPCTSAGLLATWREGNGPWET